MDGAARVDAFSHGRDRINESEGGIGVCEGLVRINGLERLYAAARPTIDRALD